MFDLFRFFRRFGSKDELPEEVKLALSSMRAKTEWRPSELELQRGYARLLKAFEQKQNLPIEDFALLAKKSTQQVRKEVAKRELLAISLTSKGTKIPDWQLDPVKLRLTQSVLKRASGVDRWTLYRAFSKPLEGLEWRSPLEAVTADSVDDIAGHVLNFLGFH